MANLFDLFLKRSGNPDDDEYLFDQIRRIRGGEAAQLPPTSRRPQMLGAPPVYDTQGVPAHDTSATRPRVVSLPPPARIALSPQARLEEQRSKTRDLQDFEKNPVVNEDKGFGGRLKDIFRQFVISAGQTYDKSSGAPIERLGAALGGGIAGGAYGGFHPEVNEERQRLYDIGRSQGLEKEIEGQITRDQDRMLTDARIQDIPVDNEIKRETLANSKMVKARDRIARRKYHDPNRPDHVQDAIDAGYGDLVAFNDRDPKTIKLGNDVLELDRTTGKWKIAGTRGDLVDWKLPDGRVVQIPASNAAYNSTIQQLGAERIASSERIAGQRLAWDKTKTAAVQDLANRQFALAEKKYNEAKDEASRKEAIDLMQDSLKRIQGITESYDLDDETKNSLLQSNQELLLKAQRLGIPLNIDQLR